MIRDSRFKIHDRRGFSIIDVLISIGIIAILFGGIYLVYFSILDVINNLEVRAAASSILNRETEVIRNMSYDSVGTVGGVPPGVIPQQKNTSFGDLNFLIKTTIRNIDDPYDGVLGGVPNDTAPADYKLIEFEISCVNCKKFVPLVFTTTVAPKSLESASSNGSLFVNVFDASGYGIPSTTVKVSNASVTPTIDLIDATNLNGILQLVGVPTSTQRYVVEVSKPGYSTDKTYMPGEPSNPNPITAHGTVAAGTLTSISFQIDKLSELQVQSSNDRCEAVPNIGFTLTGAKPIGINPNVLKFSTTSVTNTEGAQIFTGIEWDTYSIIMTDGGYDILGTIPFQPFLINPSSTSNFRFVLQPTNPPAALITVKDKQTGGAVYETAITLSKTGVARTGTTGHSFLSETNWSGSSYSSQDGVDTEILPGSVKLILSASSTYSTSVVAWFISNTIDLGSPSSSLFSLNWNPTSQPIETGNESLKFQLATNNDNTTWNFLGPDGTGATYYTNPSSTIWGGQGESRYLRYKAYLSTSDENFTPQLDWVNLEFNGVCVPRGQALFTNLPNGTYDITANAAGYMESTSSISISGAWQQAEILLQQ